MLAILLTFSVGLIEERKVYVINEYNGRSNISDWPASLLFKLNTLTFRHRASSIEDRHFATLQRALFIYLINKYISLSDICLTVHH